ncbi:MAG TPA: glycosyltransferase [Burkholderiales bacterium]
MSTARPVVLTVGPQPAARARLAADFELSPFDESGSGLSRVLSPGARLAATTLWRRAAIVHVRASADERARKREASYLRAAKACGAGTVYELGADAVAHGRAGGMVTPLPRRAARVADVVVVPSEYDADAWRRLAPGQSIAALPSAVDAAAYAGIVRQPRDPGTPLRLLFVGGLVRDQGLYEILQGLRLARVQDVVASLLVAGEGPDETALKRFAASLGLDGAVGFCGAVEGEAKLELLRDADAVVAASHAYCAPGPVLEAMAAGLPAIVTRVGAMPEVVSDGVHGLFVERRAPHSIARAIATLAADREGVVRMGEACRARVASGHSVERQAEGLASLYTDILAARNLRPASSQGSRG